MGSDCFDDRCVRRTRGIWALCAGYVLCGILCVGVCGRCRVGVGWDDAPAVLCSERLLVAEAFGLPRDEARGSAELHALFDGEYGSWDALHATMCVVTIRSGREALYANGAFKYRGQFRSVASRAQEQYKRNDLRVRELQRV